MLRSTVILLAVIAGSIFPSCDITEAGGDTAEAPAALQGEDLLLSGAKVPGNPGQGAFYPLALGNTWSYTGGRSMSIGDTPPYAVSVEETRTIAEMEELFGRDYFLEERVSVDLGVVGGPDTFTYWYRYRQDRAGLYEADVSITDPPGGGSWDVLWERAAADARPAGASALDRARTAHFRKLEAVNQLLGRRTRSGMLAGPPGGIMPDEIQRLKYPLHVRQEWTIREEPLFWSVAQRMEVLDLPAGMMNGWRISVYSELFGDDDLVYLWYGRAGFLGMTAHLESKSVDLYGSVITVVSDEELFLESHYLEGRGGGRDREDGGKKTGSAGRDLTAR
jgi:hypothetical protein